MYYFSVTGTKYEFWTTQASLDMPLGVQVWLPTAFLLVAIPSPSIVGTVGTTVLTTVLGYSGWYRRIWIHHWDWWSKHQFLLWQAWILPHLGQWMDERCVQAFEFRSLPKWHQHSVPSADSTRQRICLYKINLCPNRSQVPSISDLADQFYSQARSVRVSPKVLMLLHFCRGITKVIMFKSKINNQVNYAFSITFLP